MDEPRGEARPRSTRDKGRGPLRDAGLCCHDNGERVGVVSAAEGIFLEVDTDSIGVFGLSGLYFGLVGSGVQYGKGSFNTDSISALALDRSAMLRLDERLRWLLLWESCGTSRGEPEKLSPRAASLGECEELGVPGFEYFSGDKDRARSVEIATISRCSKCVRHTEAKTTHLLSALPAVGDSR